MRKLKVPGRIIGRIVPSPHHRYFIPDSGTNRAGYTYRFKDDTDLPISNLDFNGNLIDPLVLSANSIRTFWNSPWKDDPNLKMERDSDDIDVDSRGRDGLPASQRTRLDEGYIRKLIVIAHLNHSVGILADGKIFPEGRCWCWQTRWSNS